MKEKLIRKIFFASDYDLNAVEEYLEDMASKGLMFVRRSNCLYYFRECEPCSIHFAVDAFAKASIFDTQPNADACEYIEYCEAAGWHFIFSDGKIQFFCAESDEPIPIQTDDQIKLSLIHKHTLKTSCIYWLLILGWSFFYILFNCSNLSELLITFGNITAAWFFVTIFIFVDIVKYLNFYISNRKRIKNGLGLKYNSRNNMIYYQLIRLATMCLVFIYMTLSFVTNQIIIAAIMISVICFAFIVTFYTESHKQSNKYFNIKDNIITSVSMSFWTACCCAILVPFIQILHFNDVVPHYNKQTHELSVAFYSHDYIPLTMEQFGIDTTKYADQSVIRYASVFGSITNYCQRFYENDTDTVKAELEYEVMECSFEAILDSYVHDSLTNEYCDFQDITEDEGQLWNATAVYSLYDKEEKTNNRLVVYNNKAIFISCEQIEYNEDNIDLICNTLKP